MTKEQFEKIIEIWEHRYRYYEKDFNIITDTEYDFLEKGLEAEIGYPEEGYERSILPYMHVGYSHARHKVAVDIYNMLFNEDKEVLQ